MSAVLAKEAGVSSEVVEQFLIHMPVAALKTALVFGRRDTKGCRDLH
jgi:hypothetical protein